MSAIANFKKRREAQRALQSNAAGDTTAEKFQPAPENEALTLLAALLGCDVENAIAQAYRLLDEGAYIAGLTEEQLAAVQEQAAPDESTGDETENPEPQNDTVTADLEGAADAVSGAAEQIASTAGGLEDTASQLAYSAEDIGQVTAELKEATAELKKPSAEPASSRGGKAAPRKSNSKKSG